MPSKLVQVTYNQKNGRLLIQCPIYCNNIPKGLPNRKFESRHMRWSAPCVRANVAYLMSLGKDVSIEYDDLSWEAVQAVHNKSVDAAANARNPIGFPTHYPFKTKPRVKQLEALNKVYGQKGFALFMDMRTGKTKVVIDFACAKRMEDEIHRMIIICPLSIRLNWVTEIETHAPFPIDIHLLDSGKPKDFDKWLAQRSDIKCLIVGVESLAAGGAQKMCERYLCHSSKSFAIMDESSKIKNHAATRSKNVVTLGRMAEYRCIMTGTPIAQGVMDLFMQFEFVDPDIIGCGDFYSFRNQYAIMGGFGNKTVIGYENLDELMEIVEPFIFQVRKKEVFPDDPEKIYQPRYVNLSPKQKELYQSVKKDSKIISGDKTLIIQNTLEKMLRLQEISGGIVSYAIPEEDRVPNGDKYFREYIEGVNPKLQETLAVLQEYPESPTIIWCAYKEEIYLTVAALRKEYGDDQVVELHGDVSEADRHINVKQKFQGLKARYLVANAATGGMGLTMSAAEIEIYYSNTFNFIDREQSEERAFASGKPNGTLIIDIMCNQTVDLHIHKALATKRDVSEYVRDSIDELKESLLGTM